MKILVTGGTGLVGSTLIHLLLEKGYTDLRVLARAKSNKSLLGSKQHQVEWVVGDLLDLNSLEEAMCDIEVVFHCAALVSFVKKDANGIVDSFLGFYVLHSEGLNASGTLSGFNSATYHFQTAVTPITNNVQSLLDALELDLYDKVRYALHYYFETFSYLVLTNLACTMTPGRFH